MIHKVKYGYMKVVSESSLTTERAPDLTFKGTDGGEVAVFFTPYGTTALSWAAEFEEMQNAYYDYCAPFEAECSDKEAEAILQEERDNEA